MGLVLANENILSAVVMVKQVDYDVYIDKRNAVNAAAIWAKL